MHLTWILIYCIYHIFKRRPDFLSIPCSPRLIYDLGAPSKKAWDDDNDNDSCRRQSQSGVLASASTHGALAIRSIALSPPHFIPSHSKKSACEGLCSLHPPASKFVGDTRVLLGKGTNAPVCIVIVYGWWNLDISYFLYLYFNSFNSNIGLFFAFKATKMINITWLYLDTDRNKQHAADIHSGTLCAGLHYPLIGPSPQVLHSLLSLVSVILKYISWLRGPQSSPFQLFYTLSANCRSSLCHLSRRHDMRL